MKLIIDIPEELHRGIECRNPELETEYVCDKLMKAVDNGTPLDDVKAEIEEMPTEKIARCRKVYIFASEFKIKVLEILDNIGKAESEDT